VVKVICQKGRIAVVYDRFTGIRQAAPVCTPPRTCFLGPTRVHSPNDILIGSVIFAQFTTECRRACPGMTFPLKIALWHGSVWSPI